MKESAKTKPAADPASKQEPDFSTVPADAQEFGSDGQPRPKLSWLLQALDAAMEYRGAGWNVTFSREEIIDAGGGEKLCSVKATIRKIMGGTANNFSGEGYGCAPLVERLSAQNYQKHVDAWSVAQEKALAAAARFFDIGLTMEPQKDPAGNCVDDEFAKRLRYFREKAKLKQKDFAEKIGVLNSTYSNYETKGYEPRIDILLKMADVLGIDVNTLVGYKTNQQPAAAPDQTVGQAKQEIEAALEKLDGDPEVRKALDKEAALEELRAAVRTFGLNNEILKIVQFKYGTDNIKSLAPGLLRDLKVNMLIYRQQWQEAISKEEAAHGNSKRKDT